MPLTYKRTNSLNLLLLALTWLQLFIMTTADYPGVIELVGYSNRRARTHHMAADNKPRVAASAKMQADIETVKQNIEKYNKLLTLDTKNLPDSQKDMLERIVERVARLKESLDLEDSFSRAHTADAESVTTETAATQAAIETGTDPALLLDETTLLQLQTSMDELAAAQIINSTELPAVTVAGEEYSDEDVMSSTLDTFTDATDADDQFVAARANNKIAAITAIDGTDTTPQISTQSGSQRTLTTSSKITKSRATKRPTTTATKPVSSASSSSSSSTLISTSNTNNNNNNMATPVKRVQRPGSTMSGVHKQTTKQKLSTAAYTTMQPQQSKINKQQQQQQQYMKQQQQKLTTQTVADKMSSSVTPITSSDPMNQRISGSTSNGVTSTSAQSTQPIAGYGNTLMLNMNNYNTNSANNNDLVYDSHVNTSAIIDSLNNAREEYYQQKVGGTNNKDKKPTATAKPTKYHYYPHNQHIYLLPECAIQQVCNAVYVRLNYTQPLCACPSRYRDPCSASLNEDDQHTTKLVGDSKKKAITLAKTCEATTEMRECRSPKDWSLLALQNTRTGKSHYLVICRCPEYFKMEGPMAHDQPTYASVPGIRVFGMMCVKPGYSVRRPSVQPPKRYQLQKPYYRPTTLGDSMQNSYVSGNVAASYSQDKDMYGRPSSSGSNSNAGYHHNAQDIYQQNQHQANYQYLNRPESVSSSSNNNYRPDGMSLNQIPSGSIYGRNNERQEDTPIEATGDDGELKIPVQTSTQSNEEARTAITQNNNKNGNILPSLKTDGVETDVPAAAAAVDTGVPINNENQADIIERQKRAILNNYVNMEELADDTPEFPWDRILEFQQSINWN